MDPVVPQTQTRELRDRSTDVVPRGALADNFFGDCRVLFSDSFGDSEKVIIVVISRCYQRGSAVQRCHGDPDANTVSGSNRMKTSQTS